MEEVDQKRYVDWRKEIRRHTSFPKKNINFTYLFRRKRWAVISFVFVLLKESKFSTTKAFHKYHAYRKVEEVDQRRHVDWWKETRRLTPFSKKNVNIMQFYQKRAQNFNNESLSSIILMEKWKKSTKEDTWIVRKKGDLRWFKEHLFQRKI